MKITIDRAVVEQAQMWIPLLTEMAGLDPETTSAEFSEFADGRPASAFTIANVISALRAAMEKPQVEQEPVAVVTGFYGGFPTIRPLEPATVLPYGMALYAHPQPPFAQGEKRNDQT